MRVCEPTLSLYALAPPVGREEAVISLLALRTLTTCRPALDWRAAGAVRASHGRSCAHAPRIRRAGRSQALREEHQRTLVRRHSLAANVTNSAYNEVSCDGVCLGIPAYNDRTQTDAIASWADNKATIQK